MMHDSRQGQPVLDANRIGRQSPACASVERAVPLDLWQISGISSHCTLAHDSMMVPYRPAGPDIGDDFPPHRRRRRALCAECDAYLRLTRNER